MKRFVLLLLLLSSKLHAQNCNEYFDKTSFTEMVSPVFYIEGRNELYPCVQLRIYAKKNESGVLHIYGAAGNCAQQADKVIQKDFTSATAHDHMKLNNTTFDITQLHFTFQDGQTFMVYNESERIEKNSVYIYRSKHPGLFDHFKKAQLTDVKIMFSTVNADYKIPQINSADSKSNQNFFVNLFQCAGW